MSGHKNEKWRKQNNNNNHKILTVKSFDRKRISSAIKTIWNIRFDFLKLQPVGINMQEVKLLYTS